MHTHKNKNGYSLVEVLIAVAILMLAIVGPMTITVKSIQSAQYAHQQNTAIFLAQEGISFVSAVRDDAALAYFNGLITDPWEWVDDSAYGDCFSSDGCNIDFSDTTNVVGCGSDGESCRLYFDVTRTDAARYHIDGAEGTESPFIRRIILTDDGDEVQVRVQVEWDSVLFGGETQEAVVTTSFFNAYKD